jgi:hypothetical protein
MKTILAALTIVALSTICASACNHQTPTPDSPSVGSKLLDCGLDAVSKCASQALPPIQTCLASVMDDPMGCLTGLVGPGICATETVIACLVRDSGATARANAKLNPGNEVGPRMGDRAEAWIKMRGYTFAGPAPSSP